MFRVARRRLFNKGKRNTADKDRRGYYAAASAPILTDTSLETPGSCMVTP